MNKTFKKALSVALCIAFSGLQMSLADVLTGGSFAGRDVLNGTGAQIKGHTAGLTGLTTNGTDATLVFSANTRIDWNKLNVDKGQTLYFNNGNYGVLNNVVGGSMSKFAGLIKADNGKIVISNPNGILFNGGKFESLGGLVLTSAKYTDMNIDENTNFNALDFSRSAETSQFGNVDIQDRSVIKAGDIEIHAYGVNITDSQLVSQNSVLITADGKNYIAQEKADLTTWAELQQKEFSNMTQEASLKEVVVDKKEVKPAKQYLEKTNVITDAYKRIDTEQLQKPLELHPGINIANSAISAGNGTITLVSNTGIVSGPSVQYNAATTNLAAAKDIYAGGVYYGDLNVTSNEHILLDGQVLGTGNFEGAGITIWCSGVGNFIANDTTEDGIGVNLWNSVVGNAEVSTPDEFVMQDSNIVDANISAKDVRIGGSELAGNMNIDATGTVFIGRDAMIKKDLNVKADRLVMEYLYGYEMPDSLLHSGVFYGEKNQNEYTYNFTDTYSAMSPHLRDAIGGNFSVEANRIDISGLKANGDVEVKTPGYFTNCSFITADADGDGNGTMYISADQGMSVQCLSGAYVRLFSKEGNIHATDVNSTGNIHITSYSNSSLAGASANGSIVVEGKNGAMVKGVVADADKDNKGTLLVAADNVVIKGSEAASIEARNYSDTVNGSITIIDSKATSTNDSSRIDVISNGGEVKLTEVDSTGDIFVNGISETVTGPVNVTIDNVAADSERNGQGQLVILTNGDVNMEHGTGSNILIQADGDVVAHNSRTYRNGLDDSKGNINITAGGDVTIGELLAETDIRVETENTITVNGDLLADRERNGVGDIYLHGGQLGGADGANLGETGSITGANVTLSQETPVDTLVVSNVTATGNDGDILFDVPTNNVDLSNIHATGDVTVDNRTEDGVLDSAKLNDVVADTDKNNIGDLNIKTRGDIEATNVGGANVNLESLEGNVIVDGAEATNDIIVTAKEGEANVKDATADSDKDGNGDLIVTGKDVTVENVSGENVNLTADNDVNAKDVTGADDVIITAGNDVNGENLIADGDKDGIGDLIINAGNDANVTGAEGENVEITAGDDVNAKDVTGADDVIITAGDKVTGENLEADGDEDGIGDLIINAGGDVDINGGEGSNIYIETKEGSVDADNLVADGDDSIGNGKIVIIAPNGDVDVDGADANGNVEVTLGDGNLNLNDVNPDKDGNGIGELIVSRIDNGNGGNASEIDGSLADEVVKSLNNLSQAGVDTDAQSFTPIAFAADDDDDASLAKRIAKIVYKTPSSGIVTITDKLKAAK